VYVTHDQEEALSIADRIAVMREAHRADRHPRGDLRRPALGLRGRLHRNLEPPLLPSGLRGRGPRGWEGERFRPRWPVRPTGPPGDLPAPRAPERGGRGRRPAGPESPGRGPGGRDVSGPIAASEVAVHGRPFWSTPPRGAPAAQEAARAGLGANDCGDRGDERAGEPRDESL
jgi:hypothetical protein